MTIKQKTIQGLSWSFIDNFIAQLISFSVNIVLARLLVPAEFGVLGIITFFIAISASFVDCGFGSALIQKKDATQTDYSTVFYFNIATAVFIYGLLFLLAPFAESYFDVPGLCFILRIAGLVLFINAAGAIQYTLLIKSINFKTKTKVTIISDSLAGAIAIIMAYKGLGVWSLVGRNILGHLFTTSSLWYLKIWRPAYIFSYKSFRELFGFGYKLTLSGLINTIFNNIYYPIIGKNFSSSILGFYTQAERYTNLFSSTLTTNIQRVSYPVLSTIQDDSEKLKSGYRKLIKSTMMITFSLILGLAAIAKPLIVILIGEQWLPSVPYIQLMCFSAMLYPLHAMNLNIITVKRRSDLILKLEIIKKAIHVPLIFVGIYLGVDALLIGMVIISFIAYFLNSYYSSRLINYSFKAQLADILPLLAVAIVVSLIIWSITFFGWNSWLTIILQISIGILLTIIIYEIMKQPNYEEMKEIILEALHTSSLSQDKTEKKINS